MCKEQQGGQCHWSQKELRYERTGKLGRDQVTNGYYKPNRIWYRRFLWWEQTQHSHNFLSQVGRNLRMFYILTQVYSYIILVTILKDIKIATALKISIILQDFTSFQNKSNFTDQRNFQNTITLPAMLPFPSFQRNKFSEIAIFSTVK